MPLLLVRLKWVLHNDLSYSSCVKGDGRHLLAACLHVLVQLMGTRIEADEEEARELGLRGTHCFWV